MSEDEQRGEERGQDELIAAFAALGGPLTGAEFIQLLGTAEYYGVMVRLAALLLDGDTAAARDVVQDSLAAVQDAWGRLGEPEKTRVYMCQGVVSRSRSARRRRATNGHDVSQVATGTPGAADTDTGYLGRESSTAALRVLPIRQREAVVLRHYMGLSEQQAAQAMEISIGAARSHFARGMSLLQRPPRQ
jgi:DNA-directed RNA polymerase specialized sigma24 family protein